MAAMSMVRSFLVSGRSVQGRALKIWWRAFSLVLAAILSTIATPSLAQTPDRPIFSQGAVANAIVGGTTVYSFSVERGGDINAANNQSNITGLAITIPLPSGVEVALPSGATASCSNITTSASIPFSGAFTAIAGASELALSGVVLPPSARCSFSVTLDTTTPGTKVIDPGDLTNDQTALRNPGTRSFTVSPPASNTLVITSPHDGVELSDTTPTIRGFHQADGQYRVFVDGVALFGGAALVADASGAFEFAVAPALASGMHSVRVENVDGAYSATISVVVAGALVPAAPAISAPVNGVLTNSLTPTVSGTAVGGALVTIYLDGGLSGTVTADGSGNWSFLSPALSDGAHTFYATATVGGQTSTNSSAVSITVDSLAPAQPVVVVPSDGSTTADTTPTYAGSAEASSTVTVIVDGATVGTTTANGAGSWTFTPSTPLVDGPHTIRSTAADAAGNTSTASGTHTFTVDTVAPAAPVVVTPVNGAATTNNTPVLAGTAEPGSTVAVIVDGATIGTTTADGSGNWSFTSSTPLADGPHTIRVTAADAAGNNSPTSSTNAFTVDTAAPAAPAVIMPTNGSTTGDNTPTYSGTAEPDSMVTVIVDGSSIGTATATGAGNWGFTPSTPLADGPHTIRATATDASGNTSSSSNTNTFTVDTAPPAAPVVVTPANGSRTNDNTPTYSGTAEPGSAVIVSVDNASVATLTADGAGMWSVTPMTPLADGPHTVDAVATDASGNTSGNSSTNTFTVDTAAPAAPVVVTPANGSSTTSLTPTYTGTAEPGSTVTVTVDSGATVAVVIADGMGNWGYTQTLAQALALGTHTVQATATDATGNVSSSSSTNTFTIVPFAPAAGSVSATVAYGSTNNPITLNLTGGAADSVAIGMQASNGTATASGASITYTPNAGYAGSDSFTYTAANAGGTSSPATVTVTVSAPTLSITPAIPSATVGMAYSQTVVASGGQSPYSYAVTAGALPAGMTVSSAGVVSGTPTAGGSFNFTITATDSSTGTGPFTVSQSYGLTVNAPTISVSPMSATATVGQSFSNTFTAIGGTGPYSFAVTAGSLPAGMSLASNGQLSGTPTAGGSFAFTITATDSSTGTGPYSGSRAYTLPVSAATIILATASLPDGAVSAAYNGQIPAASGGTGPYSYAITAGALPAGMTMSLTGVLSGTPTAGGTFNFSVTATDSSTGSGPYSGTQAYSVAIAVPTITVGPTSMADGVKAIAYAPETLTASGGVAPYSYAVTAGVLPAGMSLSSGGVLSGTPTENGTFNFTVTATDSATGSGPYSGSRAYSLFIALDPPTASPVSLSVGYNSSNNPVTLNLAGGAANSIAIADGPAHGTATVTGLSITYTPASGYFGPDSFTYTATNGSGTSAPGTVTVTVGLPPAPTATGTSVAVPYASTDTAIDMSGRVTGVSTGVSVASAPAHGTVTVSGFVISYTPSPNYFGPDTFTYVAVGPGGNSAPATISLTVANPPPPVVTPTPPLTVPPIPDGSSTVDLQTLVNGVATGWRITVAPLHGSAVIEGGGPAPALAMPGEGPQSTGPAQTLRYTPAAGYMGIDTVTLVAEGPGGDSAPVTLTFQVPGIAPNRTATLASNAISTINATSGLTGGPFNSVQITRAPDFGTATISDLNIVFTPSAPNGGPTYLEYTITTPGGTSAAGRIDYTVNRAPGAQSLVANTPAGVPVTVSITANAVGGPFTGAAITSLSVPSAGTAVLTEGGVAGNRTYTITFTPAGTFTGRVDVRFALANAFATEAGVVQVNVTPRADPSLDPEVRGLVSSQVESTHRFAQAQTDNFSRRLEQLRDGDNGSSSTLSLNLNMGGQSEIDPRAAARRRLGDQQANENGLSLMETRARDEEADAFAQFSNRNGEAPAEAIATAPAGLNAVSARQAENGEAGNGSVGVWAAGAIDWGRRDVDHQRDTRFTTSGVSAGVDVKVSNNLIIGAGLGYGEDRVRVGSNDTTSDGTNYVGAVYAAMKGPSDINFEAVLGYGSLHYASRRWSSAASAFAFGEREGDMMFGSIGLAQDHQWTGMTSSIYGRIEGQSVTLDAFIETGAGIHSLTYDEMQFDAYSSTVGMRWNWQVETRDMVFTPSLRMEWAHEFNDTGVQTVSYADWVASPRYGVNLDDWARDRFQLGLEGRWVFDSLELSAGYRGSTSSNSTSHGVEFDLTTHF